MASFSLSASFVATPSELCEVVPTTLAIFIPFHLFFAVHLYFHFLSFRFAFARVSMAVVFARSASFLAEFVCERGRPPCLAFPFVSSTLARAQTPSVPSWNRRK